jgi:hypothetical protein
VTLCCPEGAGTVAAAGNAAETGGAPFALHPRLYGHVRHTVAQKAKKASSQKCGAALFKLDKSGR